MSFVPVGEGDHSILEAVFGVQTARPFSPSEIEKAIGSHDQWRKLLPRIHRQPGIAFSIGPEGALVQVETEVSGPVVFDRVKPDGSIEWRLQIAGNNIFVNCLNYTRWNDVWETVRPLLENVATILDADDNSAVSIVLQYIDMWEWAGQTDNYDLRELLEVGQFIPQATVEQRATGWHLHQGRFKDDPADLPPSRLLERIHIDGSVDQVSNRPTVKFDSYLGYNLPEPIRLREVFKPESSPTAWFDTLHTLDKKLLASTMTTAAKKRIGLDG